MKSTKKLTQKEIVELFNTEMAPFQDAMKVAQAKYEDALTLFATQHLNFKAKNWHKVVDEIYGEFETYRELSKQLEYTMRVRENGPHHYIGQECALLLETVLLEGDAECTERLEMNTTA